VADEEDSKRADGLHSGLATKLAEFRVKRLMQMLADLQSEIDRGGASRTPPELCKLSSALEETHKTVSEFCARAA
jgi:hypothetical protein